MGFDPAVLTPIDSINRVVVAGTRSTGNGLTGFQLLGLSSLADAFRQPASLAVPEIARRWVLLLRTLLEGRPIDRQARPEWDADRWEYWRGVTRVVIGGGLAGSPLGTAALRVVTDELRRELTIEASPFGSAIALVGAARQAPAPARHCAVVDFGLRS